MDVPAVPVAWSPVRLRPRLRSIRLTLQFTLGCWLLLMTHTTQADATSRAAAAGDSSSTMQQLDRFLTVMSADPSLLAAARRSNHQRRHNETTDPTHSTHANHGLVPIHLQSTLLNDTCTLSSAGNGSALILSCPGCIVFIPTHTENFDIELFFAKAVNYAYICSAIAVVQMYFIFRQIKAAEAPAVAGRLCRYTVGMEGLLDGYACIFHMFIAFNCEALFNSFIVTSCLQFFTCVLFNIGFLQRLYQQAFPAEFEGGWEASQRARKVVNIKFYTALMLGLLCFYAIPHGFELVYAILYSFWVPQILWQAWHGYRKGFTPTYIWSMSITRLILPLYFLACPANFMNHPTATWKIVLLLLWMALQIAVLTLQRKLGARFFVPKRFLPQTYNYFRAIPMFALTQRRQRRNGGSAPQNGAAAAADVSGLSAALAASEDSKDVRVTVTPAEERQGLLAAAAAEDAAAQAISSAAPEPSRPTSADHIAIAVGLAPAPAVSPAISPAMPDDDDEEDAENPCSICYEELDPNAEKSIMVCPCDHLFHERQCRHTSKGVTVAMVFVCVLLI
jgi:hypothetical protein